MSTETTQDTEQAGANLAIMPPPKRAAIVLKTEEVEKELRAMIERTAAVTNVVDKAGRQEAHAAAMMLKNARVNITNNGKQARDDAQAFSKAVIAEEKRLIAITEEEEARLFKLRDDFDAAERRRMEEEAEKERQRIAAIKGRIASITALAATLAAAASQEITEALAGLSKRETTPEEFGEFADEARAALETTASALLQLRNAARDKEEAAARAAAEAEAERARLAEQAKLQAEEAERQRQEAAKQQQERERLAAEQRRIEAERESQRKAAERRGQEARYEQAKREKAMRQISAFKELAAASGSARVLLERLESIRATAIDETYGDMADMAELSRDAAILSVEMKLARAIADELPAAHAEALEVNAQIDQARASVEADAVLLPPDSSMAEAFIECEQPAPDAGPTDHDIVTLIAEHYDMSKGEAIARLARLDFAALEA